MKINQDIYPLTLYSSSTYLCVPLKKPPGFQILVGSAFRLLLMGMKMGIVKSGAKTAKSFIMEPRVEDSVADLVVVFPPKVLIVKPIISVQLDHVIS